LGSRQHVAATDRSSSAESCRVHREVRANPCPVLPIDLFGARSGSSDTSSALGPPKAIGCRCQGSGLVTFLETHPGNRDPNADMDVSRLQLIKSPTGAEPFKALLFERYSLSLPSRVFQEVACAPKNL
jgi:hypothetical protein